MAERKYDVILVDDHLLFRGGLGSLLESRCGCRVVASAAEGEEFLALLDDNPCDIVFMDIDMPRMNGVEATRRALEARPELNVIALSMHGDEDYYFSMVEAGAKGFLLKSCGIDEVKAAIASVCDGGSYFSQELLRSLVNNLKAAGPQEQPQPLSEREKEILLLVCRGFSNQEIADKLFISKRTVDKHRANILSKTGSRNTANLVTYAIKNRLVEI